MVFADDGGSLTVACRDFDGSEKNVCWSSPSSPDVPEQLLYRNMPEDSSHNKSEVDETNDEGSQKSSDDNKSSDDDPKPSVWVGLDLGGTNAKAGIITDAGKVLGYRLAPLKSKGAADVVAQLMACAEGALEVSGVTWRDVRGVGIGTPGIVDGGDVVKAGNVFHGERVPFERLVKEAVGNLPTKLLNDADAALLAELWIGTASHATNAAMFTFGTGVGSSLALDGHLLRRQFLEGGHMIVQPHHGNRCVCGARGCLEAHASATAIQKDYVHRRRPVFEEEHDVTCEDVFIRARDGDEIALAVVNDAACAVAIGCINILRIFDPDVVVLAGGVANAGSQFLDPVRHHVKRLSWTSLPTKASAINLAAAGPHTGCIGAAKAVRDFVLCTSHLSSRSDK